MYCVRSLRPSIPNVCKSEGKMLVLINLYQKTGILANSGEECSVAISQIRPNLPSNIFYVQIGSKVNTGWLLIKILAIFHDKCTAFV